MANVSLRRLPLGVTTLSCPAVLLLRRRSVAESFGRSDWLDLLRGEGHKDERSGLGIYGTTKLFNIMLAKVRPLLACITHSWSQ